MDDDASALFLDACAHAGSRELVSLPLLGFLGRARRWVALRATARSARRDVQMQGLPRGAQHVCAG